MEVTKMKISKAYLLFCVVGYLLPLFICNFIFIEIAWANDYSNHEEIKSLFEDRYKLWYEYCLSQGHSSLTYKYTNNEPFREIVALGIPALPYIIEKTMEESRNSPFLFSIFPAICYITKANLVIVFKEKDGELVKTISGFPYVAPKENEDSRAMWMRWWNEGRKEIPQYFEMTYNEWEGAKEEGKDDEAQKKYQQIRKMGIFALPYIMAKISKGDDELIPMVSELTDSAVRTDDKPEDCVEWWQQNKEKWYIPIEDEPIEEEEEIKEEKKKE
jgi:hypothetical protein